jgi:hypothetical protein
MEVWFGREEEGYHREAMVDNRSMMTMKQAKMTMNDGGR